jgi:hypothetical protein
VFRSSQQDAADLLDLVKLSRRPHGFHLPFMALSRVAAGRQAATVWRRCPWALEQQEGMRLLTLLHMVELFLLVMMP